MRPMMLVGLAILTLVTGCQLSPVQRSYPPAADPATVLDDYLQALQAGDCTFARALATTDFGDGSLCGGGVHVTGFRVTANPATVNDSEMVFALALSTVGWDETLRDGSHTWFFQLKRQPDDRWLVTGGGTGP